MAILAIFSPSLGDLILANGSGANTQKENILAGNWFNFGNFQNLFGRSSENKGFFLKSSTRGGVYLGHHKLEAGRELSTTGSKHDGIEARRENLKLGENPNFGIMEFFEEAGGSGNIFTGYQNSFGVY
ncbi:hypothetical protein YC2023_042526 [Brassica napus]